MNTEPIRREARTRLLNAIVACLLLAATLIGLRSQLTSVLFGVPVYAVERGEFDGPARLLFAAGLVFAVTGAFFLLLRYLRGDLHFSVRSEERRVGKSVDLGGRRIIKKKKRK